MGPPRRAAAGSVEAFAAIRGLRRTRSRGKERPEHGLQRSLVTAIYAEYPGIIVVHADAGADTAARRRRLAELGAYAGFPDLALFFPGGFVLCIECKDVGGRPSAKQKETIRRLNAMGFRATFVTSIEAGLAWIARQLREIEAEDSG